MPYPYGSTTNCTQPPQILWNQRGALGSMGHVAEKRQWAKNLNGKDGGGKGFGWFRTTGQLKGNYGISNWNLQISLKHVNCSWKWPQWNLWSTHKGYHVYTSWHEQTPYRCAQNSPAVSLTHGQFHLSLIQNAMQPFASQWLHVLPMNPRKQNSPGVVARQWDPFGISWWETNKFRKCKDSQAKAGVRAFRLSSVWGHVLG